MLKQFAPFALALSLCGCATQFGHDFNSSGIRNMTPGVTTRSEALSAMRGVPQSTETFTIKQDASGKSLPQPIVVEEQYYYFRDTKAPASLIDSEAKRYAWLSFSGDKMLSNILSSTFGSEATDFDEAEASKLKKGTSTQQDVLKLLGAPSGHSIYPLARDIGGSRWYYKVRWWRDNRMHGKTLRIDFDSSMLVSDFALNISAD